MRCRRDRAHARGVQAEGRHSRSPSRAGRSGSRRQLDAQHGAPEAASAIGVVGGELDQWDGHQPEYALIRAAVSSGCALAAGREEEPGVLLDWPREGRRGSEAGMQALPHACGASPSLSQVWAAFDPRLSCRAHGCAGSGQPAAAGELLPGRRPGPADRDGPALPAAVFGGEAGPLGRRPPALTVRRAAKRPRSRLGFAILEEWRISVTAFPGPSAWRRGGDPPPRAGSSVRRRVPRHPALAWAGVQGHDAPGDAGGLRPRRRQGERQLPRRLCRCARESPGWAAGEEAEGASPGSAGADRTRAQRR